MRGFATGVGAQAEIGDPLPTRLSFMRARPNAASPRRLRHDLDQVGEGGGQVVVLGGVDGGDAGVLERPDSLRRRQLRQRLR